MRACASFRRTSSVCRSLSLLPFLGDQFNLTGLRKTIDNYEDAFDVLTGRILSWSDEEA